MDLTTIIQQLAILNNSQAQQAQQIADLSAGASKEASGVAKNIETAGELTASAQLTQLQGELNTQNARVKVANAFGTNVNAQSDIITNLAASMRETALALDKAQTNVSRIEAGSDLIGNPVGWLEDLLTGDEARAERDALAGAFDVKQKLVTNLNSATQTSVATQNAISETLTQDSIRQMSEATLLKAQSEAAKARIDSAQYGIASIEALRRSGAEAFNRNLSAFNTIQAEEDRQLRRQAYQTELAAKKETDQFFAEMADNINASRQTFNLGQPVTPLYVKNFLANPRLGPMLQEQDELGWRIRENGGSTEGVFGGTPAESFSKIEALDLKTPPAWTPTVGLLKQADVQLRQDLALVGQKDPAGQEIPTPLGFTSAAAKDPKTIQSAYNNLVKNLATTASYRIEHNKGNLYQTPPIESVLQSPTREAAMLGQSRFGQLVLKDLVATGQTNPTPELVMATGLNLVNKGELSLQEVSNGIGTYLSEGLAVIQSTGGFASTNVPTTSTYNVSIEDLTGKRLRKEEGLLKTSWVNAVLPLPAKIYREMKARDETISASKEIFDLLNPQDRITVLTLLNSRNVANDVLQRAQTEE